jgi:phosphatidate cytidylyltransferase
MSRDVTDPVDQGAARAAAVQAGEPKGGANLSVRTAAAVVMAAAALVAAWIGGFWFAAFWLAAAALALWEWQRLIGGERLWARIAVGALTLFAVAPLALHGDKYWTLAAMAIGAVAAGAAGGRGGRCAWTAAGVFYAAAILAAPTLLRASPAYGLAAILWLFAVVWGADTFAFLGGRLIGGPRLWRRVSPGKTWSGAIVGTLAGAAAGAIVGFFAAPDGARLASLFWLGVVVAIVGQIGDLAESAIKRRFTVKDSSRLIPGHGGVLDRIDAFVAAAVFAALIGWAHSDGVWIAAGLFRW